MTDTLKILIDTQYLSQNVFATDFKIHVLIPGVINVSILGITHILSFKLLQRDKYTIQAGLYILAVSVIGFVLVRDNQDVNINLVIFIVPILLAALFLDRRILIFGFIINGCAFAINSILTLREFENGANEVVMPINVEVAAVLMIIAFAICFALVIRIESLLNSAKDESIKKQRDSLTGYLNHAKFYDDLDNVFISNNKEKGEFCLAILDIDNFLKINDDYGQGLGDEIIEVMVECINSSMVNSAKAYRYGGEEFVILCRCHLDITINMIDSILRNFKNRTELKTGVIVTASSGICEYDPEQFTGKRDLFAAMEEALYVAKRLGKDQYAVWNEALVRDSFISTGKIKTEEVAVPDVKVVLPDGAKKIKPQ